MRAETTTAPPLWELHRARLAAFNDAQYNFDPERANEHTTATGWNVDDYATDLPPEAPGPPAAQGSWTAARRILLNYTFPPPDLITGIFVPDDPLEKRTLLLRGQFLCFSFWFGVRVGDVFDETRTTATGPEQVWGYNYRTLEGHFERGQISFTVHKHLQTGRVEFRIHAYSQLGRIRNPFYWLGFKLFGRMLQRRFARESLRRMREQVEESLATVEVVD